MRRSRAAWVVVAMLLAGRGTATAQTCTGTPGRAGEIELTVGSAMRMFVVRLPAGYDGKRPAPVVFLFHPFGMNTQYMQGRVPIRLAWPEAIAIYGQGMPQPGRAAGGLQPSWQARPGDADDRDLAYFDAMLDWVRKNHCIDEQRVFVMGYSNGANFTSVLACERASAIAGIAIASGSLSCTPPQPKPVVLSHGMSDPTIRYDRAIEAAKTWSSKNGCAGAPKTGTPGCFKADSCSAAPVMLCSYDGGHEYNEPFTRTLVEFFRNVVKR